MCMYLCVYTCVHICACLYKIYMCTCVSKVAFTFRLEQTRLSLSPLLQAAGCKRGLGSWSREKGKVHWPKQLKLHPGNWGWFPRKLHGVSNIVYIDYFANLAPTRTKLWFLIFRLCLWNNQLVPVKGKEKKEKKTGKEGGGTGEAFSSMFSVWGKAPVFLAWNSILNGSKCYPHKDMPSGPVSSSPPHSCQSINKNGQTFPEPDAVTLSVPKAEPHQHTQPSASKRSSITWHRSKRMDGTVAGKDAIREPKMHLDTIESAFSLLRCGILLGVSHHPISFLRGE